MLDNIEPVLEKEKKYNEEYRKLFSHEELVDFEDVMITDHIQLPKVIKIGHAYLKEKNNDESSKKMPILIPCQNSNGIAMVMTQENKDNIRLLVQVIALKLLAYLKQNMLNFNIVDIDQMGGSFHYILGIQSRIVNSEAFVTNVKDLGILLNRYLSISESIIQQRLTYKFKTLKDYNKNSGSIEPYHLLCIADFPNGFSKDNIIALSRIIKNAYKTGIYVILTCNKDKYSIEKIIPQIPIIDIITENSCRINNIEGMEKICRYWNIHLDVIHNTINNKEIENLVENINHHYDEAKNVNITEDGLCIPIGKIGHIVHELSLGFDSGVYHLLVGGETGSGKTILLHNIICNCINKYNPDELRLYLLDYKEGTEFNIYHNHPNVEKLLIKNCIQSGLEILKELQNDVISERAMHFIENKVFNLTNYNQNAKKQIPRILVIIDEFQKLFEGGYKISKEINTLIEDLAKRGRSFGIHLVLCSQSLLNTQIEKTTLNQFGLRIVFKIHKSECVKFLDYNNEAPAVEINKKGEAIYNSKSGLITGNLKIQVDYTDEKMIQKIISGTKK